MKFLPHLFGRTAYLLKVHGKFTLYKDNQQPVLRVSDSQYRHADQLGLLREVKAKDKKTTLYWELNRKAIRALHGSYKVKRQYLKYCKSGIIDTTMVKNKTSKHAAPLGGLFTTEQWVKDSRTVITNEAVTQCLTKEVREALCEFFQITDRTLRNWLNESSPMLTTPDAVDIISKKSGLTREEILTQIAI